MTPDLDEEALDWFRRWALTLLFLIASSVLALCANPWWTAFHGATPNARRRVVPLMELW